MTYIQENNPVERKTSPLNVNNPFKRVSPLDHRNKKEHKEMRKAGTIKEHRAKFHTRDEDEEREMRSVRREDQGEDIGLERRSSSPLDLNGEELTAYKNVAPQDIPNWEDPGGDAFDFEGHSDAHEGGEEGIGKPAYTDEQAEEEFNRMKYITDAAIKKGAGAVVTAKKSK